MKDAILPQRQANVCDQLHGDGQGHWGASWLPPDEGAAGIRAAENSMSVCECTHV